MLRCEVAEDEKAYLQLCDGTAICPRCQKPVPPLKAVGSGPIDAGKFCRLDCYALISGAWASPASKVAYQTGNYEI